MEWLFMHWKYALCALNWNGYMQSTGLELDSWRRRDFQMKISTRVSSKYFRIQQTSNECFINLLAGSADRSFIPLTSADYFVLVKLSKSLMSKLVLNFRDIFQNVSISIKRRKWMFIVHAQGKRFSEQSIFQKHTREMSSTLISSDIKLCANVSSLLSLLSKGLDALCNRSPLQKDIRAGSKTYLLLSIPWYLRLETLVHEHRQGLLLTKTKMVLLEISGNVAASSL